MRKRVLVAEASDTNRRVAETLLRQNGYEVISVATADKAREVLQFSRPDLLIIGGDLKSSNRKPYFDEITSNPKLANIPLMIFEPLEHVDLPFPPEVIIHLPFEPLEFVQRVTTFTGSGETAPATNPLSAIASDDEFLDAALGLDSIDVTDSEVLDKATVANKTTGTAINAEKLVGFDHIESDDKQSDSSKVESLMIREDKSGKTKQAAKPSGNTNKLEIMKAQYGQVDPSSFHPDSASQQHDYDWFINSMKEEISGSAKGHQPAKAKAAQVQDSGKLRIQTHPLPNAEVAEEDHHHQQTPATSGVGSRPKTAGVEKFIDEFKKEIEKIRSSEPDAIFIEEKHPEKEGLAWEESMEKVAPTQVEILAKQLAAEIAERIAQKIVSKIDPDKLLQMIKAELVAHFKEKRK